ncbi:MAG: hypothetical protein LBD70_02420 [Bifidobacteriaceae bacterium]|jgi:hypothetical protein|nr:hypothetical protein [Bifidobacteriaceae bacterium]
MATDEEALADAADPADPTDPADPASADDIPGQTQTRWFWTAFTLAWAGIGIAQGAAAVAVPQLLKEWSPETATADLSTILTIGGFAVLVATPILGRLSDRSRSRLGLRRPWILYGSLAAVAGNACAYRRRTRNIFPSKDLTNPTCHADKQASALNVGRHCDIHGRRVFFGRFAHFLKVPIKKIGDDFHNLNKVLIDGLKQS